LPVKNQKIKYDPDTATVFLEAEYLSDIENTNHELKISYINNPDFKFYASDSKIPFTALGINSELVID
jgi:hypothetical protein